MAIYSLRMTAVGKSTQMQPFTAAAHLKYITRKQAVTHVLAARMPDARRQAIAWLKREEREDRKNARVIDKLVLALPRELSSTQQYELVRAFAEELTQGRASWLAAFHTKGKDANNPHCHLILRDRDVETKRRVMFLSAGLKEAAKRKEKGQSAPTTLKAVRALWERHANAALGAAGRSERIDRRTLKEQGVRRRPQVHEGPNIRAMHRRGFRPRSVDRVVRNSPYRRGRATSRVVRYPDIDKGMTRAEYNDALRASARAGSTARVPQSAVFLPAAIRTPAVGVPRPVDISSSRVARSPGGTFVTPSPGVWRSVPSASSETSGGQPRPPPPAPPSRPVHQHPPATPPASGQGLTLTQRLALGGGVAVAQPRSDRDRGRGR